METAGKRAEGANLFHVVRLYAILQFSKPSYEERHSLSTSRTQFISGGSSKPGIGKPRIIVASPTNALQPRTEYKNQIDKPSCIGATARGNTKFWAESDIARKGQSMCTKRLR